jgi:hypothetical protein
MGNDIDQQLVDGFDTIKPQGESFVPKGLGNVIYNPYLNGIAFERPSCPSSKTLFIRRVKFPAMNQRGNSQCFSTEPNHPFQFCIVVSCIVYEYL